MSVLALFSGLLYKGSYNVEVRLTLVCRAAGSLAGVRGRSRPKRRHPRPHALQRRKRRGARRRGAGGAASVARPLRLGLHGNVVQAFTRPRARR